MLKNILFILKHMTKALPLYTMAMISCSVFRALVTVGELFITKQIINFLIGSELSFAYITLYYLIYIILDYICTHIHIALTNIFKGIESINLSKYMRGILYNKIKILDINCYENYSFYNDYERVINEIDTRPILVADTISEFIYYLSTIIFITAIILEPVFILASFIIVIKHLIYLNKLNKLNYELDLSVSHNNRKLNYIKELFKNTDFIKEAKIFKSEDFFIGINGDCINYDYTISKKYYNKSLSMSSNTILLGILMNFIVGISIGFQIISKKLLASDFVYLFNAFTVFADNLTSLFQLIPELKNHSMYIDNIRKVLDYIQQIPDNENGIIVKEYTDVKINIKDVNFSYPNTKELILNNISLEIVKGSKIALVGENGCGKSTLIKLILYFYKPDKGEVLYNNIPYQEYNAISLRNSFGVLFQDFQLYAFTIAENVLMRKIVNNEDEKLVIESLKFSGIWDKIKDLNNGIHSILTKEFDDEGIYLSGGEYQKLVIARAYARECDILIFDEPSSALDPVAEYEMFQKLMNIGNDKTVIYISHRLSSSVHADMIYLLDGGTIREHGKHDELMKIKGKYYEMFTAQAESYIS